MSETRSASNSSRNDGNTTNLSLASVTPPELLKPVGSPEQNYSKRIGEHLLGLMEKVTEKEVTPSTVTAACHCANSLHKIMRLSFDIIRDKRKESEKV